MVHQPLIASYKRDFEWLFHFLTSFRLKAKGFAPPVVVVPSSDAAEATKLTAEACPGTIVRSHDVPERHKALKTAPFMRAQVAMMAGDVHCPDADYVWLWGSDCFVTGPLVPGQLFEGGLPVMFHSTYRHLKNGYQGSFCWLRKTTEALGWLPESEYMRRLPLIYPRQLYAPVRHHVARSDRFEAFEDYVYAAGEGGGFSESNVLGAYAARRMPGLYHWVCVDGFAYGDNAVRYPSNTVQFWSHGGIRHPCDEHHRFSGRTPLEVMESYYASWREGAPLEP